MIADLAGLLKHRSLSFYDSMETLPSYIACLWFHELRHADVKPMDVGVKDLDKSMKLRLFLSKRILHMALVEAADAKLRIKL